MSREALPTEKTTAEKPLPQGGPGSTARLFGGALAMVLILGMTLAVFLLYHWQQKNQLGTGINGMNLSPSQKPEPPPEGQSQLALEDIQGLHLELEEKREEDLPLQPPYYDLGVSPTYRPLSSCLNDSDVHYAELDTSALERVPGSQTTVLGPGEAVEYATIQLSPPEHRAPSSGQQSSSMRAPGPQN